MTEPTRTHDLHTYKVLAPDWLTKHEPRVLEHMVTHPDSTYEMSMMSEIGDGTYVAWSTCARCSKHYTECACKEGPLEPNHVIQWREKRWSISFDARPDLGHDRELTGKVVEALRERGYVLNEVPDPVEVEVKVPDHSLFVELFRELALMDPPKDSGLSQVLDEYQEAYDEHAPAPVAVPAEPDSDDLADARDDLGDEATEDSVQHVADQRASVREDERKLDEIQVDF